MRSAFGYDGQKCSANSRVYVERAVARPFLDLLAEKAKKIRVGDPDPPRELDGPGHQRALAPQRSPMPWPRRSATAGRSRRAATCSTTPSTEHGYFPTPTVVSGLPTSHRLFRDELFVPFIVVGEVDSLDEALRLSNDTAYGLTAGIFSHDDEQIRSFLDTIQAGRRLREPPLRRDHRRVARDPELRRLEGLRLVRQERPRPVLRDAVPARAVADGDGTGATPGVTADELPLEPVVDPSGWFSVQLRYAYLVDGAPIMIEDRVVLIDGEDEETALGHAIEVAEEYEDEFETDLRRDRPDPLRGDRGAQGARRSARRRHRGVARVHGRPAASTAVPRRSRSPTCAPSRWPSPAPTTTDALAPRRLSRRPSAPLPN